jgi:hypothetical protein
MFTTAAYHFLYDLIEGRNYHTHMANTYDVFCNFRNITIPVGNSHNLIFNPLQKGRMVIDLNNNYDISKVSLAFCTDRLATFDMQICEQYTADLILEVLTKREFEEENPNEPDFGTCTHALIVYYGKTKVFAYLDRVVNRFLKLWRI